MNEDDVQIEMLQRAAFGKQVEQFFSSDIGQYMIQRAREQKANAISEFMRVNCGETKQVWALQNKIAVAENVIGWLIDAVQDGTAAYNILEDRS